MRGESCIPTLIWNLSKEKLVFFSFLKKMYRTKQRNNNLHEKSQIFSSILESSHHTNTPIEFSSSNVNELLSFLYVMIDREEC